AVAREILHTDFRFRGSLGPEKYGPEGFIEYMHAVHVALAGYTCIIDDIVAAEGRAAVRLTFRGQHRNEFFGIAATGKQIEWAGAAFFTCDDRQITELWVLGDIDAIRRQLGAETTDFESESE
ncbi:MAG: ester cyclase, partial [Hyphomicrobiaceae bacterium]